jgi:hypothetical protein
MDPKLTGSIERILTVVVTYALAKASSHWQTLTPDLVLLIMAGGSAAYGWWSNRKSAILTSAATLSEVKKIELVPTAPETPHLNRETPNNVVIGDTHV